MASSTRSWGPEDVRREAFAAVTAAFASLGRVCLALDAQFRICHLSPRLDDLLGMGAAARYMRCSVEELLGSELFGRAGPMCRSATVPSGQTSSSSVRRC